MSAPKRPSEANVLRDLERQLDDLRKEVRDARADSAASIAQMDRIARVVRVSRRALTEADLQSGWDRLKPDVSLINWTPRQGAQDQPELGSGLIDRLKSGNAVSDSMGNVEPFVGAANAIVDPTLETFGSGTVTTTEKSMGPWRLSYSLASGSVTTDAGVDDLFNRGDADNPFNSEILGIEGPEGTAAHDATTLMYQFSTLPAYQTALPYVVASVQILDFGDNEATTDLTTATVTIEIYDTDSATVLASKTHDLLAEPLDSPRQLTCYAQVGGTTEAYQWRLKLRTVKGVTGASQKGFVFIGEPQLHLSYTTDALPYQPTVAVWVPSSVTAYGTAGGEAVMRLLSNRLEFGPGSATRDVLLERTASGVLRLHENGVGVDATLQIGDDVKLMDVDVADSLGIQGVSTAANGKIVFGSGKDTNVYRGAADTLQTDDKFNASSSFPSTTLTGFRWFRTDYGLEFYYDGTRWVSTQVFTATIGAPDVLGATGSSVAEQLRGIIGFGTAFSDLYLIEAIVTGNVAVTNDASNYWPYAVVKVDAGTGTTIVSGNTSTWTPGTWNRVRHSIAAVHALSGMDEIEISVTTKTGSPGNWYMNGAIHYRLVAT